MKSKGRKAEEKPWDTTYRHSFYTSYAQDPDLHVLMFVSGTAMNSILREALRDYMRKHSSRASDPEFQRNVFMLACQMTADGSPPIGSEVLLAMNEPGVVPPPLSHNTNQTYVRPARAVPAPTPLTSAQVIPVLAEAPLTPTPEIPQIRPTAPLPHLSDTEKPRKPPVTLDFGPDPEIDSETEVSATPSPPKVSQRDRWLARHKN